MAAEVESMFYAFTEEGLHQRKVPWHGGGTPLDPNLATKRAAIKAAGLDWRVDLHPTFYCLADGTYKPIEDNFAVVRDRDEKVLGTVGSWYRPVQNESLFDFGQALVENSDARWETAGALRGGKVVWATLYVPGEQLLLGGDEFKWFLLLSNSHDGSKSFRADITGTRVVCMNTLQWALAGARQSWSIRHVGEVEDRVSEAQAALGLISTYEREAKELADKLVAVEMSLAEFETFIKKDLIPDAPKDASNEERVRAQLHVERQRAEVKKVLVTSPTIEDAVRHTRWGALNAVTEWAEWVRPLKSDKRIERDEQRFLARAFDGGVVRDIGNRAAKKLVRGLK